MKVKLAKTAGFCMGVRRAMEMVLNEVNKSKGPICTFGPIIHNKQVIDLLESKGVKICEDIEKLKNTTTLIRAHGIPPDQRKALKEVDARIIDATCPHVIRVQAIIHYHTHKGSLAIVVGDKDHPEVIGLIGHGNGHVRVINKKEEIPDLPSAEQVIVVAQTTQDEQLYQEIVQLLRQKYPGLQVFNTICKATRDRQSEIRAFSGHVDGVVVVGGYHSANTRRLVQIAAEVGLPTYQVETEQELDRAALASMETIGVTAGASTPNWMIKNVVSAIESIKGRKESAWRRLFLKMAKFLFLSNIMIALGAFSLSYTGLVLTGQKPDWLHPVMAMLYIYAMHVLNRFLDKGATTYNDPERALFYRLFRKRLIVSGSLSVAASLAISSFLGIKVFLVMIGLSLLGIVYSIPIIPVYFTRFSRYSRIKDIPGSKTLSEALAWSVVITFLPQLESQPPAWSATLLMFWLTFSIVFVRSGLMEILEAQGDRIVGIETLPINLGERRTLFLLKAILLLTMLTMAGLTLTRTFGPVLSLQLLPFFFMYLSLMAYERKWIYPGLNLEALVNGNLLLAGLLCLIHRVLI